MELRGNLAVTLSDLAKRMGPDGKIEATVIQLLAETNEILEDMKFIACNETTGHKTIVSTGLPEVFFRMLNHGVPQSKSTTQPIMDTCGMLEGYSEVDVSLVNLNSNKEAFRFSEDRTFLEAMNEKMAHTIFYGDTKKRPQDFKGLTPRFNALGMESNGQDHVLDAGGTADKELTSGWLIGWGERGVHGIYPKGSKAGFIHQDLGEQTVNDAAGGKFQAYRTHYKWDCGLAVKDFRQVVRIANIDLKTIAADKLVDMFSLAADTLQNAKTVTPVFYCNRSLRTKLREAMRKNTNTRLNLQESGGKHVISFDEIPVKLCDGLVSIESKVIAKVPAP